MSVFMDEPHAPRARARRSWCMGFFRKTIKTLAVRNWSIIR